MRNRLVPGAGLILLALSLPDAARATTWCFPNAAACPGGVGTVTSDVEAASRDVGTRSDGTADTIYVGANQTYTDTTDSLQPSGTDALTIQGAGTTSVLSTNSTNNVFVVNTSTDAPAAAITLKNLRIVVPASIPDNNGSAVMMRNDTLDGVDVDVQNPGGDAVGTVVDGGTVRNTHVYASGSGSVKYGVRATAGTGTLLIDGVQIDGGSEAIYIDTPGITATVRRATIVNPTSTGITARSGGTVNVSNSLIRMNSGAPALLAQVVSADTSTLTADHVTVNQTAGGGVAVRSLISLGIGSAAVTVTNSIMRGFFYTWDRNGGAGVGSANISISSSDFKNLGLSAGNGTVTIGSGNIDADPLFTSATDFRLQSGSPAIDAGAATGAATNDLADNARVVDGNGDCVAKRDMGAYEFQTGTCVAPALAGTGANLAVTSGDPAVAVDPALTLTDPNPGTMASAVVTLAGGQSGDELGYATVGGVSGTVSAAKDTVTFTGPVAKDALANALRAVTFRATGGTAGQRTVTFRVNDGQFDSNTFTRTVDVTVPSTGTPSDPGTGSTPGTGTGTPGTGATPDTTAPVITGLTRKSRRLPFTLSEAATVTWRLAVRRPGRMVKGRCVAPTAKNRSAKACRRWVSRKPVTVTKAAGAQRVTLPRTLAPGTYRATLVARDAAGNRSAAARVVFTVRRR